MCGFGARGLLSLLKRYGTQDELQRYREKFTTVRVSASTDETRDILRLPEGFRLLAAELGTGDKHSWAATKYLRSRGLGERDLWYFKFGISEKMFRRVIMPSFDNAGSLNFYTARAIDSETRPKYIDPPKEIIEKTEIIFNEINIDWTKELVIVEGPFDLTKCPDNSTCLQGNQLSEQMSLFNEIIYHDTPVVIMLDDDAKLRSSLIAKKLHSYGIGVRVASILGQHDPGDMTREDVELCISSARHWIWEDHIKEKFNAIRMSL